MNKKGVALVEIVVSMLILAVSALAVTATVSLVNSKGMRSAGGSSLDLQALSQARETLEKLKRHVSSDPARHAPLNVGTHTVTTDPWLALPAGDLATHGGVRQYTVSDVVVNGVTTGMQKVTVTVQWPD